MIATVSVHDVMAGRDAPGTVVVDVRTPDEFARDHVADARLLPLHLLPLRVSELSRSQRITVVCESGARSAQACAYLEREGYDAVSVEGGMAAWRAAGLPVATGAHQAVPA